MNCIDVIQLTFIKGSLVVQGQCHIAFCYLDGQFRPGTAARNGGRPSVCPNLVVASCKSTCGDRTPLEHKP